MSSLSPEVRSVRRKRMHTFKPRGPGGTQVSTWYFRAERQWALIHRDMGLNPGRQAPHQARILFSGQLSLEYVALAPFLLYCLLQPEDLCTQLQDLVLLSLEMVQGKMGGRRRGGKGCQKSSIALPGSLCLGTKMFPDF